MEIEKHHGKEWVVVNYDLAYCPHCPEGGELRRINYDLGDKERLRQEKKSGVVYLVWICRETPCVVKACSDHDKKEKVLQKVLSQSSSSGDKTHLDGRRTNEARKHGQVVPRYITRTFVTGSYTFAESQPYTTEELECGKVVCKYDWSEKPRGFDWVNDPEGTKEAVPCNWSDKLTARHPDLLRKSKTV